MAFKDRRRTDQNTVILPNPYWVVSKVIDIADVGINPIVLFSFPRVGLYTYVHAAVCQIITPLVLTGPFLKIGIGTIPLDTSAESATLSVANSDEYIPVTDITEGTPGYYPALSGTSVALWANGQLSNPIVGADSTVPVIYATPGTSAPVSGTFRCWLMISDLPGSAA